jgi:hypothetical protein
MEGYKLGRLPKGVAMRLDLSPHERSAVAQLIREHLRTTRNLLAPSLKPLKSAYAKLDCVGGSGNVAERRSAPVARGR